MKLNKISGFLILAAFIFVSQRSFATHIVGGEITAEYLGTTSNFWEYKITIRIYKDCGFGATGPFDNPLLLTIYEGNNQTPFGSDSMWLPVTGPQKLDVIVNNPCLQAPPDICTELGVYVKTIQLPISVDGYTLTYQRCCRNGGIVNVIAPGGTGSTYTIRIPGTNEIGNSPNSSPSFDNYPPMVLCLDDPFVFNHKATDIDGDSLAYSLCTPYDGGSQLFPIPFPAPPPPYTNINWSGGYSGSYQIASLPAISIDPVTGILSGTAIGVGKYVVGVCVSEYRNGVFLSENKRDFQFTVTFCDANSVAAASSQERFCEGLTVEFSNSSQNARTYFWDFGEPQLANDTSNLFEPTWTYSDTGKYSIMLIANPGYSCADTVYTEYEIYDLLEPFFTAPEGQCFEGHSFNLEAGGLYQEYANFEWIFGSKSVTSGSFDENPEGVKFTEPGVYPVSLIIRENGCEEEYIDTLYTYPKPIPRFDVKERSGCVPIRVKFEDNSVAWSDMTYLWNFGDGITSTEANPKHVYPKPGIYDVSLLVSTNEVCVASVNTLKIGYIKVNEIPEAVLGVDRNVTSILDPVIKFKDFSKDISLCNLDLGDGIESPFCDYTHHYWKPGHYRVRQVVSTQFGCNDTNYIDVFVKPEVTIFVPNAFTPNSDNHNEFFKAYGEPVKEYDFRIYNRWGELMFLTNNIEVGWDGKKNGVLSPNDTYIYVIKLTDAVDEKHEVKGSFTLLK